MAALWRASGSARRASAAAAARALAWAGTGETAPAAGCLVVQAQAQARPRALAAAAAGGGGANEHAAGSLDRIHDSLMAQAEYASSAPKGELRHSLAVQGYDEGGFVLSGGQRVAGALLCAADVTAGWAPEAPGEVTPDHLKLLELVWPPVETLVVGTGEVAAHDALPAATKEYLRSRGITMDVRPTPSAAYTFGVLREEGRAVAAALFPMGKGSMDGGRSGIYSDARG